MVQSVSECTETHKLLRAGEVEQFHEAEVVARDDVEAGERHTRTADLCFVGISWPNPQDFISQDAEGEKRPGVILLLFDGHTSGSSAFKNKQSRPETQTFQVSDVFVVTLACYLVQVAQVILSMASWSLTSFPEGTSNTCR